MKNLIAAALLGHVGQDVEKAGKAAEDVIAMLRLHGILFITQGALSDLTKAARR